MRALAVVFLLMATPGCLKAQQSTNLPVEHRSDQSISGQIGTLGAGLFYNHTLSRNHRLSARAGGQYLAYRKPIRIATAPDSYLNIDPDFVIGTAQVGLKWHPFKRSSLFVAAGAGYTWHPGVRLIITASDKLNLGGLELTPEDVGRVDLAVRWHPVVGYVGWGFGRTIPRRRINVGMELGVFYLGRPTVQLAYEGFLETTNLSEQVPVVERNLSNYRYLPSLSLTLAYALQRTR